MKTNIGEMIKKRNEKVKATAETNKKDLAREQSEVKKSQPKEVSKSQEPAFVEPSDKGTLGV